MSLAKRELTDNAAKQGAAAAPPESGVPIAREQPQPAGQSGADDLRALHL